MIRVATNAVNKTVAVLRATLTAVWLRLQTKWNVDMLYTCMNTMQDHQRAVRDGTLGQVFKFNFNFDLFERLRVAAAEADDLRDSGNYARANEIALVAYRAYVTA